MKNTQGGVNLNRQKTIILILIIIIFSFSLFVFAESEDITLWSETDLEENNLQLFENEHFKFLYPANAELEVEEKENIIYVRGPEISYRPVEYDAVFGESYTFRIEIFDNPDNLSAEQWAVQRNIESNKFH